MAAIMMGNCTRGFVSQVRLPGMRPEDLVLPALRDRQLQMWSWVSTWIGPKTVQVSSLGKLDLLFTAVNERSARCFVSVVGTLV